MMSMVDVLYSSYARQLVKPILFFQFLTVTNALDTLRIPLRARDSER
jgi:hypothetical protein